MGAFNNEDLKQLEQLFGVVKRAHFKELSASETLTVALSIQFLGSLKEKLVKQLQEDKINLESKDKTETEEPKKKVKK